jgi:RNA polymerase primary sigma factor
MENLLEKMIKEEKFEELARLDAIEIVNSLFSDLLDREKDILSRRFGLKGDKSETLEKIGSLHKLTRERVRQIESASIKKIKKLENLESYVDVLKNTVNALLDEHGGLIRQDYLLDILTVICLEINNKIDPESPEYEKSRQSYKNHFNFLISKLINEDLETVNDLDEFNPSLKIKDSEVNHFQELATDLIGKVEVLKKALSTEELMELLKELDSYNKYLEKLNKDDGADISSVFKSQVFPDKAEIINNNKVLYSLVQAMKNLEQNKYGEWGPSSWGEIKPKTVNDKIYLVLKHNGAPLHFTDIATKINEMGFDKKTANAATVHNELILDDRYFLASRGTYGLKEWEK